MYPNAQIDTKLNYLEAVTKSFFQEHENIRQKHINELEQWRLKHDELIKIWNSYEKIHEKLKKIINDISEDHNKKIQEKKEAYKLKTSEYIEELEQKINALKMTL